VDVGRDGQLVFYFGPMDSGKSTLALQMYHNLARPGKHGLLFTHLDRQGDNVVSSRLGVSMTALNFGGERFEPDVFATVDFIVIDEAQFLSEEQVEGLAVLVDENDVEVYAFGLATDFRTKLFSGSKRLFELADEVILVQLRTFCWCGRRAFLNARILDGKVMHSGPTVLVGDTGGEGAQYAVLCRRHHRSGQAEATFVD